MLAALAGVLVAPPARAKGPSCPTAQRAHLVRDRPEELLACRGSVAPIDRVWAARALASLGRHAEAAQLFASLRQALPALAVELSEAAAKACSAAGPRDARCLRYLPSVSPERRWRKAELEATRAQLALSAGDTALALRSARLATESGAKADAMDLVVLEAAAARHLESEAAKALHDLRVRFPGSFAAGEAERFVATSGAVPDVVARYPPADLARRWARWTARGGAAAVAAECPALARRARGAGIDVAQARLACAGALGTMHDPAARRMLLFASTDARMKPAALLALAHLLARGDDPKPVERQCRRLRKLGRRAFEASAECDFLAAAMVVHHGSNEAGRAALEAVERLHSGSARARDAAWLLALDDLRARPADARAEIEALVRSAADAAEKARALYWRGRARGPSDVAAARADWAQAEKLDPYGYYAWLAAARLGQVGKTGAGDRKQILAAAAMPASGIAAVQPTTSVGQAAPAAKETRFVSLLLRAGFAREAAAELQVILSPARAGALAWAPLLARADQFEMLLRVGLQQGALAACWPPAADQRRALEAAYPLAFPEALEGAPAHLDPFFLLALMRRESRFDPEATSAARARGLLQLLPRTAARLAGELGMRPVTAGDLDDPSVNVRLAGRYVADLVARFSNPLLVAAAYNAGPRAVAAWAGSATGVPIDEWVERIPYRETRAYVKAVGGAYAAYALLYRGSRPPLSLAPLRDLPAGIAY